MGGIVSGIFSDEVYLLCSVQLGWDRETKRA